MSGVLRNERFILSLRLAEMRGLIHVRLLCRCILRNEAIRALATLFLQARKLMEGFVEGALVGGLVAQEES